MVEIEDTSQDIDQMHRGRAHRDGAAARREASRPCLFRRARAWNTVDESRTSDVKPSRNGPRGLPSLLQPPTVSLASRVRPTPSANLLSEQGGSLLTGEDVAGP